MLSTHRAEVPPSGHHHRRRIGQHLSSQLRHLPRRRNTSPHTLQRPNRRLPHISVQAVSIPAQPRAITGSTPGFENRRGGNPTRGSNPFSSADSADSPSSSASAFTAPWGHVGSGDPRCRWCPRRCADRALGTRFMQHRRRREARRRRARQPTTAGYAAPPARGRYRPRRFSRRRLLGRAAMR
jgi:hypothetical protein